MDKFFDQHEPLKIRLGRTYFRDKLWKKKRSSLVKLGIRFPFIGGKL
jgi:hypothetical protein